MIFISAALHAEARPFIQNFKLKAPQDGGKPMFYGGDDVNLVVSGTGKIKSAIAVASFLGKLKNYHGVLAVNVGICGSPAAFKKGDLFLINKIKDHETEKSYYPDLLVQHDLDEAEIETFNRPVLDGGQGINTLIDMEASGFWEAAATFLPPSQILIFKIVSDHMDNQRITKETVYHLVNRKVESIMEAITRWQAMLLDKNQNPFTQIDEKLLIGISRSLNLTVTQQRQLERTALLYKLRTQQSLRVLETYLNRNVNSKYERNRIFDEIRQILVPS